MKSIPIQAFRNCQYIRVGRNAPNEKISIRDNGETLVKCPDSVEKPAVKEAGIDNRSARDDGGEPKLFRPKILNHCHGWRSWICVIVYGGATGHDFSCRICTKSLTNCL